MPKPCRGIGRNASARDGADHHAEFVLELSYPRPDAVGGRGAAAQQPCQSAPARERLAALRLQARALVLALAAAATANGQALRPEQGDGGSGRATAPFVHTGVAIHHGQELHYEVIDGLAVHGGDMVLGPVEEVAAEHQRRRSTKAVAGSPPVRRDLASIEDEFLWPDGVIPYVIESGFSPRGLSDIEKAIHEWNSKTVITLVQRTTETDYVRFLPTGLAPVQSRIVVRSWDGKAESSRSGSEGPTAAD